MKIQKFKEKENELTMKQKTKLFSFHVFIDLLEKAKKLAQEQRRSTSSVINQALDEFFDRTMGEEKEREKLLNRIKALENWRIIGK